MSPLPPAAPPADTGLPPQGQAPTTQALAPDTIGINPGAGQVLSVFDFDGTLSRRDSLLPFLRHACGTPRLAASLLRLSPAGEVLQVVETPIPCPTMPCFGGPDLQTLFITSSRQGRSDPELALYPNSGCIFAMRVGVAGLPVNFYQT